MIYIASDHAGFKLKEKVKKYFTKHGVAFLDLGAESFSPEDDYPLFARNLAEEIAKSADNKGIIICGTGLGSCIVANKVKGIRATSAWNKLTAQQAREHLDANVLCLGGRTQSFRTAKKVIETWLKTDFSKGERHIRRINMME